MNERTLYKSSDDNSIKSLKTGLISDSAGTSMINEGGIRIGPEFQAELPDLLHTPYSKQINEPMSIMVWHPNLEKLDNKVNQYLEIAASKYGYNQEQALGLLFWHHHNIDKSIGDLPNFVPMPEHWDTMDQVLFEQGFAFFGKNFHRIHSMMVEKSVGSLVKYYYSWKRMRNKISKLDLKPEDLQGNHFDKGLSSMGSNASSDSIRENEAKSSPYIQSKRVGHGVKKSTVGIYLDPGDLKQMVASSCEEVLKKAELEVLHLQRKVGSIRGSINHLKQKTCQGIEHFRPPEISMSLNSKWTPDEMLLCVLGFSKYGKDFTKIAEVIGTKNESLIRDFYHNYRHRYDFDLAMSQFEKEHNKQALKNKYNEKDYLNDFKADKCKSKEALMDISPTIDPNIVNPIIAKKHDPLKSNFQSQFDRFQQLRAQYGDYHV